MLSGDCQWSDKLRFLIHVTTILPVLCLIAILCISARLVKFCGAEKIVQLLRATEDVEEMGGITIQVNETTFIMLILLGSCGMWHATA